MHDSTRAVKYLEVFLAKPPSLGRLDLFLLRLRRPLVLATFPIVRVRHLVVAPTALVRRVVLLGHVGVGIGLEVFVEALVVFVG